MTIKLKKLFLRVLLTGVIAYLLLNLRSFTKSLEYIRDDAEDDDYYDTEVRFDFDEQDRERLIIQNDENNMRWVYVDKNTIQEKLEVFNEILMQDLSRNSFWNTSRVYKQAELSLTPEQCSNMMYETIMGSDANSHYKFDSNARLQQKYVQTYFLAFRNNRSISLQKQLADEKLLLSNVFHPCVELRSTTDAGGYVNTLAGTSRKICRDRCVTEPKSMLSHAAMPAYLISADYEAVTSSLKCSKRHDVHQRDDVRDIITSVDAVFGASVVHRNGAVYLPSGHQIITHCCNPSMDLNRTLPFKECHTLKSSGKLEYCNEIFVLTQQHAMGNYYHMLIEQLPRVLPFLDFLRDRSEICLHVARRPGSDLPDVILESFGLTNRVISGHSTARVVYIPHGGGCHQVNLVNTQLLAQVSDDFLRRELNMKDFTQLKPVAILLKRKRRFLINHDSIWNAMQKFCTNHSVECIVYDDTDIPSYVDTQLLFKRAILVVGGHGAGLSNIAFCQPGTIVVEVQCDTVARPCFRNLAGKIGLRFVSLMSQLSTSGRVLDDQHCNKSGLEGNMEEIHEILTFIISNYTMLFPHIASAGYQHK